MVRLNKKIKDESNPLKEDELNDYSRRLEDLLSFYTIEKNEIERLKNLPQNEQYKLGFLAEDDLLDNEEVIVYKDLIPNLADKKKYSIFRKCQKASVVGDTVGDPLKDTSGPSLNILIKLSSIISVVFGTLFMKTGFLIKN